MENAYIGFPGALSIYVNIYTCTCICFIKYVQIKSTMVYFEFPVVVHFKYTDYKYFILLLNYELRTWTFWLSYSNDNSVFVILWLIKKSTIYEM